MTRSKHPFINRSSPRGRPARIAKGEAVVYPQEDEMKLARYGHHPDPAIDFCVEVDAIEGLIAEYHNGLSPDRDALDERLAKAIEFRAGGDVGAHAAKRRLNDIVDALLAERARGRS